ncbi:FadR/GntR family transcriptional regulator [Pseudomonas sp. RIT-PI-S]|uniref:FadR/GntR family transcriptional regulator n=1 Tax=Pseudomonas sp. RIT-PI-S TaxID=3035295 RepID=UPI0021D99966|nr:FadR/GntR family transcriptional regulator [Pseudomonas sp. RIT-PI-S]
MESDPLARRRTPNLAHDLVNELTQRILRGDYATGQKLPPETVIVSEHGVSRTVVREALSKLQAAGLVETRHGVGTFVVERQGHGGLRLNVATLTNVRSVLELRMGLETQAAALAAGRRSDTQLTQMREALDEYGRLLANNDDCVAADRKFHLLIAQATGNNCFPEMLLHLGTALIPRTQLNSQERGGEDFTQLGKMAQAEHEAIYRAIRRKDPDAARAAMLLHLSNSLERFDAGR